MPDNKIPKECRCFFSSPRVFYSRQQLPSALVPSASLNATVVNILRMHVMLQGNVTSHFQTLLSISTCAATPWKNSSGETWWRTARFSGLTRLRLSNISMMYKEGSCKLTPGGGTGRRRGGDAHPADGVQQAGPLTTVSAQH